MKRKQATALSQELTQQLSNLGARLARLRIARQVRQEDAAIRAGISRSTATLIEKGAASVAIGQVIRYLDAIAPGKTLERFLMEEDPAVISLSASERRRRARTLSEAELKELEF